MNTRTIRGVTFLVPDEGPDLTPVVDLPPTDTVVDALITGDTWDGRQIDCDIRQSQFSRAALTDARFNETTVSGCIFSQVDLSGSRWREVNLDRTVFRDCRLLGAQLSAASLRHVIFEDCRLDYTTFDSINATGPVAFLGCTFTESMITRAKLPAAIFHGCRLTHTELVSCQLRDTDLRGNDLTTITGITSLAGARITETQLTDLAQPLVHDLHLQVTPLDA